MLYAIVDPESAPKGDVLLLARQVVEGGASWVQLRAKRLPDAALLTLARTLVELCGDRAKVIINDRPDIAAQSGAAGVHMGQQDLAGVDARSLLNPGQLLGVSTHHLSQVEAAVGQGADIIGFGPVWLSGTKQGHAPVTGLDALADAVRAAKGIPVVAIGGVDASRARACIQAGASMVAVIGALAYAPDPKAAAANILAACRGNA